MLPWQALLRQILLAEEATSSGWKGEKATEKEEK
jgi:hypothetical protein